MQILITKKNLFFSYARILFLIALVVFGIKVYAQDASGTVDSRRAQLEAELAQIEAEIGLQKGILENKQRDRVSLERDVAILNAKIDKARLSIKARNLSIQGLQADIKEKEATIGSLSKKIDREKESLAQFMRKINEIDSYSLAEIVLANQDISDFFVDLDSFDSIKLALRDSFIEIEDARVETESEKTSLESKIEEEIDLRKIQELEKKRTEEQEAEKSQIVKVTKGVEAEYQKVIKAKEKSAASIRAELFTLRGSAAIPFEKALGYAQVVSAKTGVRAAVILGIIAEESNLGENVGTGNWKVDMKNPRDTVPFLDITTRLGLNPDLMPVSKKPWYGYGGAMGPAQFIPSTWIQYEARIGNATGHNPPNPWDPQDAFMATGLLMMDNGADKGTRAAERLAALRYLAGWTNATKSAYAFYGDDVMELSDKYQNLINILNGQ